MGDAIGYSPALSWVSAEMHLSSGQVYGLGGRGVVATPVKRCNAYNATFWLKKPAGEWYLAIFWVLKASLLWYQRQPQLYLS